MLTIVKLLPKFKGKENLFLTIQLFFKFDFGHPTSKLSILDHQTIKTIYI